MDRRVVKVAKLAAEATSDLLIDYFSFHGKIEDCVVSSAVDGEPRVGYVRFYNAAAAQSALLFDKAHFLSQSISVELSGEIPTPEEIEAAAADAPTAPPPKHDGALGTTARISVETGMDGLSSVGSAAASSLHEPDAVLIERPTSYETALDQHGYKLEHDGHESFETVEREEAVEPGEASATGSTPLPPTLQSDAAPASSASPPTRPATSSAVSCFAQFGKEPLNDPRAVMALTLLSLIGLAIW